MPRAIRTRTIRPTTHPKAIHATVAAKTPPTVLAIAILRQRRFCSSSVRSLNDFIELAFCHHRKPSGDQPKLGVTRKYRSQADDRKWVPDRRARLSTAE